MSLRASRAPRKRRRMRGDVVGVGRDRTVQLRFDELPESVRMRVLRFLPVESVKIAAEVSRSWHVLANSDTIWKELYLTAYPDRHGVLVARSKTGALTKRPVPIKTLYQEAVESRQRMSEPAEPSIPSSIPYLVSEPIYHTAPVNELRVRTLGREEAYVVTAGEDKTLRIMWYHKLHISCVRVCRGHRAPVIALELSDEHIFSGSIDRQVIMWDFTHHQHNRRRFGRMLCVFDMNSVASIPDPYALQAATTAATPGATAPGPQIHHQSASLTPQATPTPTPAQPPQQQQQQQPVVPAGPPQFEQVPQNAGAAEFANEMAAVGLNDTLVNLVQAFLVSRPRLLQHPLLESHRINGLARLSVSIATGAVITAWYDGALVVFDIASGMSTFAVQAVPPRSGGAACHDMTLFHMASWQLPGRAPKGVPRRLVQREAPTRGREIICAYVALAGHDGSVEVWNATRGEFVTSIRASVLDPVAGVHVVTPTSAYDAVSSAPGAASAAGLVYPDRAQLARPAQRVPSWRKRRSSSGSRRRRRRSSSSASASVRDGDGDAQPLRTGTTRKLPLMIPSVLTDQRQVSVWRLDTGTELGKLPVRPPNESLITCIAVFRRHAAFGIKQNEGTSQIIVSDVDELQDLLTIDLYPWREVVSSIQFDRDRLVCASKEHGIVSSVWLHHSKRRSASDPPLPATQVFTMFLSDATTAPPVMYDDHKLAFIGYNTKTAQDSVVVVDYMRSRLPNSMFEGDGWGQCAPYSTMYNLHGDIFYGAVFCLALLWLILLPLRASGQIGGLWTLVNTPLILAGLAVLMMDSAEYGWMVKRGFFVYHLDTLHNLTFLALVLVALPISLSVKADFFPDLPYFAWTEALIPLHVATLLSRADNIRDLWRSVKRGLRGFKLREHPMDVLFFLQDLIIGWSLVVQSFAVGLRLDGVLDLPWMLVFAPLFLIAAFLTITGTLSLCIGLVYPLRDVLFSAERARRMTSQYLEHQDVGFQHVLLGLLLLVVVLLPFGTVFMLGQKLDLGAEGPGWGIVLVPMYIMACCCFCVLTGHVILFADDADDTVMPGLAAGDAAGLGNMLEAGVFPPGLDAIVEQDAMLNLFNISDDSDDDDGDGTAALVPVAEATQVATGGDNAFAGVIVDELDLLTSAAIAEALASDDDDGVVVGPGGGGSGGGGGNGGQGDFVSEDPLPLSFLDPSYGPGGNGHNNNSNDTDQWW